MSDPRKLVFSARKIALALQFARDEYANSLEQGFLIDPGTVIVDKTTDSVLLTYDNGEKYLLTISKVR